MELTVLFVIGGLLCLFIFSMSFVVANGMMITHLLILMIGVGFGLPLVVYVISSIGWILLQIAGVTVVGLAVFFCSGLFIYTFHRKIVEYGRLRTRHPRFSY